MLKKTKKKVKNLFFKTGLLNTFQIEQTRLLSEVRVGGSEKRHFFPRGTPFSFGTDLKVELTGFSFLFSLGLNFTILLRIWATGKQLYIHSQPVKCRKCEGDKREKEKVYILCRHLSRFCFFCEFSDHSGISCLAAFYSDKPIWRMVLSQYPWCLLTAELACMVPKVLNAKVLSCS